MENNISLKGREGRMIGFSLVGNKMFAFLNIKIQFRIY